MAESNIPQSWVKTKLGILSSDISYGYTASSSVDPVGPKMLRITDIQDNRVNWESVPFCEISDDKIGKYRLSSGDLVFARTGATVGKSYLLKGDIPESVYASYLIRVRCTTNNNIEYLSHFFRSPDYWNQITEFSAGVGQPNVNGTKLKELSVPVPPLNEQTRIANKLDELLAQVDTIKARVDAIPAILKRFRQSVLAAAVSGKLTEEWRELNELCEFKSDVEGLSEFRSETLTDLPGSWKWLPFNAIAEIASNLKDPNSEPDSIHIAPNHIESNSGKFLEFRTVAEDGVKSAKHGFVSGQILYSKIRPYLNKVAIAHFSGLCSADMYPIDSKIETKFLFLWMLSFQFVDWASNSGSRVVLPKINQKSLNEIPTPVPSMKEQKQIVSRVEQYFSFADQIEQRVKDAQSRINNLTQSILAKAFRGELVPQDPNDEPASELLERIKKEREQAAVLTKATKKVTKKKAKAE